MFKKTKQKMRKVRKIRIASLEDLVCGFAVELAVMVLDSRTF